MLVHTKPGCKYCDLSKTFLNDKNIPYTPINYDPLLENYDLLKSELMNKTNHYTFPLIFIGDTFVGGYSELVHAYETCKLHDLCRQIGIHIEYDF